MATKITTAKKTIKRQPSARPGSATAMATREVKATSKSHSASEKRISALDAAAQVLAAEGQPMSAGQLIEALAAKGLWKSPGGKTPAATLYSAILREVTTKGAESRFVKTERGRFALRK